MTANYIHALFTDEIRALQRQDGSRDAYARMEAASDGSPDQLGDREQEFIAARDSFYIATVTSEGWPYVQHRGGPAGFLQVLDESLLGFADFNGNRQHVSIGNTGTEPRVSLFLMDYPNRRRLKILGHARIVPAGQDAALVSRLKPPGYCAGAERAWLIEVVGFDWNCPQHITPRFTEAEFAALRSALAGQAVPRA